MRPIWSFRRRLTWMILCLLFSTLGFFFVLNYQLEKRVLTSQVRHRAQLISQAIQINLARVLADTNRTDMSAFSDEERRQIREFIGHFQAETQLDAQDDNVGVRDVFFIDTRNHVVIDDPVEREGRILPPPEQIDAPMLARLEKNKAETRIEQQGTDTILLMTVPLFHQQHLLGFGRIELLMNPEVVLLEQRKIWGLITAGGLFIIGTVVASYVAKYVTRPIGELVQAAGRIGRRDFSQRLDESRKDEIGVLMTAFNRMADGILKLEETQTRVERLESLSQLGPRLAHEIKNPLNGIGLIIDHVRDRFAPTEPAERDKFFELTANARHEVDRLNETLENFLRSSAPPSLSRQLTDVNDLAAEAIAVIAIEAHHHGVKITRQFDQGLPRLLVDPNQLRQALVNLLTNALQAMPNGGEVSLSTARSDTRDGEVAISVRDTGHGIRPEHVSRLFDPYFTTKQRGFGLGLAIVARIVQEHGGRIDVNSEPGQGAVFTLLLPIRMEEPRAVL